MPGYNGDFFILLMCIPLMLQAVGKCHQAVAQMHIFYDDLFLFMLQPQVIVTEVPEGTNPQLHQLMRQVMGGGFGMQSTAITG